MTIAIAIAIALTAGAILALVLRLTKLSWSVALVLLPIPALLWPIDHGAALATLLFVATFAGAGAYRSIAARRSGGEVRERECARSGIVSFGINELATRRARANRIKDGRLALGAGARGIGWVPIRTGQGLHCFITGSTGSGKTVSAAALLQGHLRSGNAVIAIDPKGDGALAATLRSEAQANGVGFVEFSPRGPGGYNVAARGDASEIADKVLSAHEWSEPHYHSVALRFVQREVEVLRLCGLAPSLQTIAHYMDAERLEGLAAQHQGADGDGDRAVRLVDELIESIPRRMLDDLAGARSRVQLLPEASFGKLLDPASGIPMINLAKVIDAGGVAYFRLDADRYPELSRVMASSLVIDLITLSSDLQGSGAGAAVFIDEFAAVAAERVSRLFATGRSAGLSVILATQGLSDLDAARSGQGQGSLAGQVLQNIEFVIAHRQGAPESAAALSEVAGTYPTWVMTEQFDDPVLGARTAGGRFPTRAFRVHPDTLKSLGVGEAVLIEPARKSADRLSVWPPDQPR